MLIRRWLKGMALAMSMFVLTGCWDSMEINNRSIILELAIDKNDDFVYDENKLLDEQGIYNIEYSIPDFGKVSGTQSLAKDMETGIGIKAPTLTESVSDLQILSKNTITFSHVKSVMLGESLMQSPELFKQVVESMARNMIISRNTPLLGVNGPAALTSKIENNEQPILGLYIMDYFNNKERATNFFNKQVLGNFIKDMQDTGISTLPVFHVDAIAKQEVEANQSASQGGANVPQGNGESQGGDEGQGAGGESQGTAGVPQGEGGGAQGAGTGGPQGVEGGPQGEAGGTQGETSGAQGEASGPQGTLGETQAGGAKSQGILGESQGGASNPARMGGEGDGAQSNTSPTSSQGEASAQGNPALIDISGGVVIKDYKLVDYLTKEEVRSQLFVQGKIKNAPVVVVYNQAPLTYTIKHQTAKVTFEEVQGQLQCLVEIEVEGNVSEYLSDAQTCIMDEHRTEQMQQLIADEILAQVRLGLDKAKEINVDFMGLGLQCYRKENKLWDKYRDRWEDETFKELPIAVGVNVTIESTGIQE